MREDHAGAASGLPPGRKRVRRHLLGLADIAEPRECDGSCRLGMDRGAALHHAGDGGAAWILAEGTDAAVMTRSVPVDKAMGNAILAYLQNGEALRPEQGYPLRLILPGYEGNTYIKRLRRLEVSDTPFMTREGTSKCPDLMPDGRPDSSPSRWRRIRSSPSPHVR